MKQLSFLFLIIFPFFLQAQITLDDSDVPQAGDVLTTVNCDVPANFDIGTAGANQTYDLSAMIPVDTSSVTFISPSGTAGIGEFPNATLASETDGDFVYYQKTSTELFLLGLYIDTSSNNSGQYFASKFNPPNKVFEIPTTYNTSFTDMSSIVITQEDNSGFGDSIRLTNIFEDDVLFDGYGTVITPDGSFQGLRERNFSTTTSIIEILTGGNWVTFNTTTVVDTSYNWYSNNNIGLASASITNGQVTGASYSLQSNVVITPNANFSTTNQGGGAIEFTDNSSNNPTGWLWDFGDGNTSTQQNPTHTYATAGNYTVCLTASNSAGSNTFCMTVSVSFAPIANFTSSDSGGGTIIFTDNSSNNPTSWVWDFGDGNTSTQQNPTHTYTATGTYTVCLTVTNNAGSNTICMDVTPTIVTAPVASFSFTGETTGTVDFTDNSTNSPISWVWDFGDGNTSTDQNPQHIYAAFGTYNVCLTATNSAGSNMVCQDVTVTVPPVATYTFITQSSGTVDFTDASTNNPTSWLWDFGDGNTSMDQNPQHTYTASGMYTVCLTVTNTAGSNTICETVNVVISSIKDLEKIVKVELFPNPIHNTLNIRLENDQTETLNFQMIDVLGRSVKEIQVNTNGSYDLDVKNLGAGMYYYIFTDQDGYVRNKGSLLKN